uniref:Uncharacterized protein n=1 Tax=Falco tinnunculus TaxID=100819 RepID=A0A8C4UIX3_FALTI
MCYFLKNFTYRCLIRSPDMVFNYAEYVNLKHYMERKIQELEGELACQKQGSGSFKKLGYIRLSLEFLILIFLLSKVKLLTREQEALKETGVQTPESQQTAECFYSRLEEENKFNDFVAVKDTWHEELARAAKEKDVMPASVKEAQVRQFKKLKQQIRELQMRHKSLEVELCRREWSRNACLREKDALIRKLQEEIIALKPGQDSHLIKISTESASKEFQIQSTHRQEEKLRAQLAKFQKDLCSVYYRYQQQLSLAAEQEWILEHSKMQTEPDWQQLCENVGSNLYQKSEELTQSLSSAREQVEADPQKTDHRLHEVKTVLSALTAEREQAIHASFNHSTLPEGEKRILQYDGESSLSKEIPNLEIKKLQEQNANLRAAIAQMRKEMENLDEQTLSSHPPTENRQLAEQGDSSCHRALKFTAPLAGPGRGGAPLGGAAASPAPGPAEGPIRGVPPGTRGHSLALGTFLLSSRFYRCCPRCVVERVGTISALKPHFQNILYKGLSGSFQGPNHKILEEKINLGQQLPDTGPGVGFQYCVSCTVQGTQNKLKEAVKNISVLSQEKQQLIEMGNKLRAELRTIAKEGKFILQKSKISLWTFKFHATVALAMKQREKHEACFRIVLNPSAVRRPVFCGSFISILSACWECNIDDRTTTENAFLSIFSPL